MQYVNICQLLFGSIKEVGIMEIKKRLWVLVGVLMVVFVGASLSLSLAEGLPSWVNQNVKKSERGDMWLFSGSVYDMSLVNIAVPLARSSALSNMATSIGVAVNSSVSQKVEGSEIDGYTESVSVSHGYILDRIIAYGVRQKEQVIERVHDPISGRMKFNVHVLLEVTDKDLQKAKMDFSKRAISQNQKPIMRSSDESKEGFLRKIINIVGL
jgi:hypothetical protein